MKTTMLALPLIMASMAIGAQASELRMTVEKPHFTCEGHGQLLSHVAYVPGADASGATRQNTSDDAPLPCCDGQIGCAQFLSTNTILHPSHPLRG